MISTSPHYRHGQNRVYHMMANGDSGEKIRRYAQRKIVNYNPGDPFHTFFTGMLDEARLVIKMHRKRQDVKR